MDFLIHWPPGPVVATVQCKGLPFTPGRPVHSGPNATSLYCVRDVLLKLFSFTISCRRHADTLNHKVVVCA